MLRDDSAGHCVRTAWRCTVKADRSQVSKPHELCVRHPMRKVAIEGGRWE